MNSCAQSRVTGTDIARVAIGYLGVPYVHLGRSRHGVDCAGLVLCVAHDLGLTDWDDTNYSDQPDPEHLKSCVEQFCKRVCCGDCMQAGDVLLLEIRGSAQHLAICTQPGRMVHAYQTPMMVVEHSIDAKWRRRLRGVYRWRGLAGGE
jgi:cell wall-associated NlpC family hydrolase